MCNTSNPIQFHPIKKTNKANKSTNKSVRGLK